LFPVHGPHYAERELCASRAAHCKRSRARKAALALLEPPFNPRAIARIRPLSAFSVRCRLKTRGTLHFHLLDLSAFFYASALRICADLGVFECPYTPAI